MAYAATNSKQQAHELINRLSTGQASAAVIFINAMLDPRGSRITNLSPTKKSWPSSA
jgi:hypothetical protein